MAGEGLPVVLLHGFLEDKTTWQPFSQELAKHFKVLAVDIPGHGKSDLPNDNPSIPDFAKTILPVLDEEQIDKAFVIGHSMGGYIASAFADLHPERLSALCLFHSTPFADSDGKKIIRDVTIQKVKDGKKGALCRNHAPKVFASKNLAKFIKEIKRNEEIALSIDQDTIIATLTSMRNRQDYSQSIKNLQQPLLYIEGKSDNFIPYNFITKKYLPEKHQITSLSDSGHIGFLEEPKESLEAIITFSEKFLNTKS